MGKRFFYLAVAVMLFTGCATKKELHEEQVRSIVADMLSAQEQTETHVIQQITNVDSIISVVWQRTMDEMSRQEQEHEITTETLTETIDSLGRVVRQSQKTTDRTTSKQEQQRIEHLQQSMQQQISKAVKTQDSLWQQRFETYQQHISDSLAAQRDLIKQTDPSKTVSWWTKTWAWLRGVIIGLGIAALLLLTRKWWWKRLFN